MFNYEFIITEKCNWNCYYCVFPTLTDKKHFNIDNALKHLEYMNPIIDKMGKHISIVGGEIGFIKESILYNFIKSFNKKVSISTNGLFLRNYYHKGPMRKHINEIMWHASENCDGIIADCFVDDEIDIIPGVVCNSIEKMMKFIKRNDHINFRYVKFDDSINAHSIQNLGIIEKCKQFHTSIVVDLVNERLCLCQRNYDKCYIDLNKDNFIKLHRSFPKDVFKGTNRCNTCNRLCVDKTQSNDLIESRIKFINLMRNR